MTDRSRSQTDLLLLLGFCAFLFFFGLNSFGLIGADEPRYAQIAREMLGRHDWVTPVLGGKPWLEKPVLYYWEAMISYRILGVSDWAARIPSALDATLMVLAVFFFLRGFRRGFELDGALMTASAAGVIGFARAASPDMPLSAAFTIGLLAWYAWYERRSKVFLATFYGFAALGTLAKGPVAAFLAAVVIIIFAAAVRDLAAVWRTLWLPGILLFCALTLPWYVAVQLRNPEFFRTFILEHNLARFGTNLYHHQQPFWYYAPVALLGLLPWSAFVAEALLECIRLWWADRRQVPPEQKLDVFLIVWLLVPILFFSLSQSKLPGYIVPALPAGTILLAEYLRRHVTEQIKPPLAIIALHSTLAVLPLILAITLPYILVGHRFVWSPLTPVAILIAVLLAAGMIATLAGNLGVRMLRFVTLVPVVLTVAAIIRIGGPTLDERLTARPLAREIAVVEAGYLPAAVYHVPREIEYGLAFYRNQRIQSYDRGEIPAQPHLLVTRQRDLPPAIVNRRVSLLGTFPPQNLEYYWVSAPIDHGHDMHHMP